MTDFSDTPPSLGERRATLAQDGSKWSPREALIAMLRDIDAGTVQPTMLTIVYHDAGRTRFVTSAPNAHSGIGMLEIAKHYMLGGIRHD